ncbi:hypothetical protein [uncultured Hoeflea sp.]|uniref:hypothetical protein n=1 Tax=uncultured Hoeflea sp. TaxID=538666 RepID=UPI0030EF89A9
MKHTVWTVFMEAVPDRGTQLGDFTLNCGMIIGLFRHVMTFPAIDFGLDQPLSFICPTIESLHRDRPAAEDG